MAADTLGERRMLQAWRRPRARVADESRAEEAETRLSDFWTWHVDASPAGRLGVLRSAVRDPARAGRAALDMLELPEVAAHFSDRPEGRLLSEHLNRRMLGVLTLARSGACVLQIPARPGQYSEGPRRQTLRRKARAAQRQGVSTHSVTSRAEQETLAAALTAALRVKTDHRYRQDADHSFLVGQGPWTVARAADGTPLVVAVTPFDGEWALLQCFITLGEDSQHSDARYLLTAAVVDRLSALGVRYLVDSRPPAGLTNGLRHFQRILGFRITRVLVSAAS